ncbi:MAG: hypothetical protein RL408_1096 [Bacteroidota bacterium]
MPLHAFDLSIKLFSHRRALVCRLYHDDHAIRAIIVLLLVDLLGFSASEASAFTLDRPVARLWIYREND